LEAADAAKADDDRMDEFARVINGAKDDFATVLHDIGELREKFAQVNARFQKFTGTADENFATLHGLVDDYHSRLNKVTSKLHILQQSHNWLSDRVLVLKNDTVRKLAAQVKGMEELQEEQASRDVDTRLQALEDCLNDQAEEIAILRGKVCRCKKPVEVVDVATVFKGIEDLYVDAPQGTRRTSSLDVEMKLTSRLGSGSAGTSGSYMTPALAPVNTLVPVSDSEGAFDRLELSLELIKRIESTDEEITSTPAEMNEGAIKVASGPSEASEEPLPVRIEERIRIVEAPELAPGIDPRSVEIKEVLPSYEVGRQRTRREDRGFHPYAIGGSRGTRSVPGESFLQFLRRLGSSGGLSSCDPSSSNLTFSYGGVGAHGVGGSGTSVGSGVQGDSLHDVDPSNASGTSGPCVGGDRGSVGEELGDGSVSGRRGLGFDAPSRESSTLPVHFTRSAYRQRG
jgi:hypothetical protein